MSSSVQRLAELSKQYRLGGAYIHTFGPGHLHSVVNMCEDPDLRGNPRGINSAHVDNLFSVFATPGSKHDHESPIYLMVRRDCLSPELLSAMSNADPRDPAAKMPMLAIHHEHSDLVLQLEEQLLSNIKDGRWMSTDELAAAAALLADLRRKISLATLLNGNHRIQAILRHGNHLLEDQIRLVSQVRQQTIGLDEMRAAMQEIQSRVQTASYRVEVFDSASELAFSFSYFKFITFSGRRNARRARELARTKRRCQAADGNGSWRKGLVDCHQVGFTYAESSERGRRDNETSGSRQGLHRVVEGCRRRAYSHSILVSIFGRL